MECTAKIQTTQQIETTDVIENKEATRIEQHYTIEEESRKHRKYLAQQEALRQLERIKAHAIVAFRR